MTRKHLYGLWVCEPIHLHGKAIHEAWQFRSSFGAEYGIATKLVISQLDAGRTSLVIDWYHGARMIADNR